MTDINPTPSWANVRQLETNEFATGGANGNMNEQAKSLAARSELLKQYAALPYESKTGGYALNERVQLATGDIVRSTIASNVNNPNENMTGWVNTNDASQIRDARGQNQQQINDLHYQTDIANVKYWGAKGDGVTDDSDAIQACVDAAIARQSNRIFFPFDLGEKYRLTKTINLLASGFHIDGNRTPTYQMHLYGGYIFADDNVVELFNYNNGQSFTTNQLTISGVAFYQDKPAVDLSQTFMRFNANNNGPHRGIIVSRCSARGFRKFLDLTVTTSSNLSAANVVVHDGCVFTGGYDVVFAGNRLFNLLVKGIQAEQGAKFTGFIDGGVSIKDNMLEGQSNTITIDSNSPSVIIENNYMEYAAGDYFAKVKGTNNNAYFEERNNYVSSINSTDFYLLSGILRLKTMESPHIRTDRVSLITLNELVMVASSVVTNSFYVATSINDVDGVVGMCNPLYLPEPRSSAVYTKNLGGASFVTPFGKTKTGLLNTGVGVYTTLNKSWAVGDIITAVALIKSDVAQTPIMQIYNEANVLQGTSGGASILYSLTEDWHLIAYSRRATIAGTAVKIRFSTGVNGLKVAAIGVDVTPQADFKTFNSKKRAEVRLFNPFVNQDEQILSSTESFTIPEIAAGGTYTRDFAIMGATIGDAVVMSPNVDLLGLDWFAQATNINNVKLRIVNRTSAPINVGASTWCIRVMK